MPQVAAPTNSAAVGREALAFKWTVMMRTNNEKPHRTHMSAAATVLHVTSIPGGGVDRHVRDIIDAAQRHHLVWHAGDAADAIEDPVARRYYPIDRAGLDANPGMLERWLRERGVGLVHLHSMSRAVRARGMEAARTLGVPHVATLHDVLFLGARGFEPDARGGTDPDWCREVEPVLRSAAAITAPSRFVADLAARQFEGLAP